MHLKQVSHLSDSNIRHFRVALNKGMPNIETTYSK